MEFGGKQLTLKYRNRIKIVQVINSSKVVVGVAVWILIEKVKAATKGSLIKTRWI